MSGQPWFASTTSGGCGPESASLSTVWRSPKPRLTRLIVTLEFFCSKALLSSSQIALTLPVSWSQTVRVTGFFVSTPVFAGFGGAFAGPLELPGVQDAAAASAAPAPRARNSLREIRSIATPPPKLLRAVVRTRALARTAVAGGGTVEQPM